MLVDIPDITDSELWIVQSTVNERWGKEVVGLERVDVEARLDPSDRELTNCPAFYWEYDECHFVIIKVAEHCYRTQFFYGNREQYGTGRHEYDDLAECVVSLLRLQADHESTRSGNFPNSNSVK